MRSSSSRAGSATCFSSAPAPGGSRAIGLQRVTVGPAPGEPPRLPFWHGEGPGRSAELGAEVGALCRRFEDAPEAAPAWLVAEHHLTARAAANLSGYLADQRAALGVLPTDRRVVVEHFTDELGNRRLAIHTPLGKRVTTPLGLVLARRLAEVTGVEPSWVAADDGVLFRLPAAEAPPPGDPLKLLSDLDLEGALTVAVGASTLFGARFRENAARALLLPRRAPGQRTPLYLQRLRAQDLLEVARRHPDFPGAGRDLPRVFARHLGRRAARAATRRDRLGAHRGGGARDRRAVAVRGQPPVRFSDLVSLQRRSAPRRKAAAAFAGRARPARRNPARRARSARSSIRRCSRDEEARATRTRPAAARPRPRRAARSVAPARPAATPRSPNGSP